MPTPRRKKSSNDSNKTSSASARKRQAAKSRKIAAIKKKLKVGRIRNSPKHDFVLSRVKGDVKRANSIESGKSRMAIYEDSEGVKIHIRRLEAGTEQDLGLTMAAVIDRFSNNKTKAGQAEVVRVFTSLDDLSRLDEVDKALKSLKNDPRIKTVEFDKNTEIQKFKKNMGIRENDTLNSDIVHLKNYLQKESGERSNNAYQKIIGLLDQAISVDQKSARDATTKQAKFDRLGNLSKQIEAVMKQAESTHRSDRKAEQRNMALKNMKVMLDDHLQNAAKDTGEYGPLPDLSQFDPNEAVYGPFPDLNPESEYGAGPAERSDTDIESEYGPVPPKTPIYTEPPPPNNSIYAGFPPLENTIDADGTIEDSINREEVDMEIDDGVDDGIASAVDSAVNSGMGGGVESNKRNDSTNTQSDQSPPSREQQVKQIADGIKQIAVNNPMLNDVLNQLSIDSLSLEAEREEAAENIAADMERAVIDAEFKQAIDEAINVRRQRSENPDTFRFSGQPKQ